MIIFKIVVIIFILVSLATIAVLLADALTGFRYEWLDELAQIFIAIFSGTVLIGAVIAILAL